MELENVETQAAVEAVLPKKKVGRPTRAEKAARELVETKLLATTKKPLGKSLVNELVNKILFTPERIANILEKFYTRALENDKVLLTYVDKILPRENLGGLTIVIKTPVLAQAHKKHDIDGTIMDAEVVEETKQLASPDSTPA